MDDDDNEARRRVGRRAAEHGPGSHALGRMWRWIGEQAAFAAVLAVLVAAFVYLIIEPGRWGRSSGVVGVAVLLGGVLRVALPSARVGLLAVRSRLLDSVLYLVLGGVILGLDIRLHH